MNVFASPSFSTGIVSQSDTRQCKCRVTRTSGSDGSRERRRKRSKRSSRTSSASEKVRASLRVYLFRSLFVLNRFTQCIGNDEQHRSTLEVNARFVACDGVQKKKIDFRRKERVSVCVWRGVPEKTF